MQVDYLFMKYRGEGPVHTYLSALDSRHGRCMDIKFANKGGQDKQSAKTLESFC